MMLVSCDAIDLPSSCFVFTRLFRMESRGPPPVYDGGSSFFLVFPLPTLSRWCRYVLLL